MVEMIAKLQQLVAQHMTLDFPEKSENDHLNDAILELSEYAGWVIGLAECCIRSAEITQYIPDGIPRARSIIDSVRQLDNPDEAIRISALEYADRVDRILDLVKLISAEENK